MNIEEKETILNLISDFRSYCPNITMAGDGSFRWANGNYCTSYEVLSGIHDAKGAIDKLGVAIEAIDVDDA